MARTYEAAPNRPKFKPAFVVQELDGEVDHTIITYDNKTRKRKETVVKEKAGFLVQLMRGHSIRVRNKEDLERLGFNRNVPIIDQETGDEVGDLELA